jgi:hypothetical protein
MHDLAAVEEDAQTVGAVDARGAQREGLKEIRQGFGGAIESTQ